MLTYQIRPRVFRIEEGQSAPFPAECEVRFHLGPPQPFGLEADGGRTLVQGAGAELLFNANTGAHTIRSKRPLKPLDVAIEDGNCSIRTIGNLLTLSQLFESSRELAEVVESIYFGIPVLLNVEFADPPIVERVDGTIGGVDFRWELQNWNAPFQVTTQEDQERKLALSWERIKILAAPATGSRRLLAALHYFHVAARLSRQGMIAGEFLAEMILNLSKVLEVLFPPKGDGRGRDAARQGLKALAFSETEIEADYIPAMALRNEIDVAHVDLSLFKPEQLATIHGYVERAEVAFQTLLQRVLTKVASGEFEVEPYQPTSASKESAAIVDRLRQYADRSTAEKEA